MLRVPSICLLLLGAAASAGTVKGTVTTHRKPTPGAALPVTRDQRVCGTSQPDESLVVSPAGGVKDAVVFVENPPPSVAPAAAAEAILDQRGCRYAPHVQALRVGTRLVALNSDDMLHTVHGMRGAETVFNQGQPLKGMKSTATLSQPGLVHVGCDAGHTWMSAWIYVFDHPYFAITGADGSFELRGLPPGTYTLNVWHETLGTAHKSVAAPLGDVAVSLTLP